MAGDHALVYELMTKGGDKEAEERENRKLAAAKRTKAGFFQEHNR
jgi:hypothetical protein